MPMPDKKLARPVPTMDPELAGWALQEERRARLLLGLADAEWAREEAAALAAPLPEHV